MDMLWKDQHVYNSTSVWHMSVLRILPVAIRAIAILIQPGSTRSKAFLTLSAGYDQLLALLKGPPGGR